MILFRFTFGEKKKTREKESRNILYKNVTTMDSSLFYFWEIPQKCNY